METYSVIRGYFEDDYEDEVIATGVTLEEAQEHCNNPETSSSTCTTLDGLARTEEKGPWFDRYMAE